MNELERLHLSEKVLKTMIDNKITAIQVLEDKIKSLKECPFYELIGTDEDWYYGSSASYPVCHLGREGNDGMKCEGDTSKCAVLKDGSLWQQIEQSEYVDEARTIARKLYAEVKRLKEMNTDMFSDIQENCASCGLHSSDCTGCPFQYYHKRSR